jgi:hypothetical protein
MWYIDARQAGAEESAMFLVFARDIEAALLKFRSEHPEPRWIVLAVRMATDILEVIT